MNLMLLTVLLAAGPIDQAKVDQCLKPTVGIVCEGDLCGSGVIVKTEQQGPDYLSQVLTCYHVVDESRNLAVMVSQYDGDELTGNTQHQAVLLWCDPENDVALLAFRSEQPQKAAEIDSSPVKLGDEIMRIGHGLGQAARFDFGQVTWVGDRLRLNCTTVFGDSGGPIFRNNKLIGIAQAISVTGNYPVFQISWAVPVPDLPLIGE